MSAIQSIEQIAIDPAVRGGRPFILGSTITVADIAVAKVYQMLGADEIAEYYGLTLPQVYAALSFYYEHKPEIDESISNRRALAAQMKEQRVGSKHPRLLRGSSFYVISESIERNVKA